MGRDIEACLTCGRKVRIIACIGDPVVMQKILAHLQKKHDSFELFPLPESQALPGALFG